MGRRTDRSTLALALLVPLALLSCVRRERRVVGRVTEFGSGRAVPGAMVTVAWSGWGRSPSGGVVWDREYTASGGAGPDGRFAVVYRGPASVQVTVRADGFQPLTRWYGAGDLVSVSLKRRDPAYRPLPSGLLALGEAARGERGASFGGWRFAGSAETGDSAQADLVVTAVSFEPRLRVAVRAPGAGGVRFVPAAEIGADGALLLYTDEAPADGYAPAATLEPGSRPGVLFVRTRDGGHYAKLEVAESAASEQAPFGGRRAALFRYVYNPTGGRDLRYQEP